MKKDDIRQVFLIKNLNASNTLISNRKFTLLLLSRIPSYIIKSLSQLKSKYTIARDKQTQKADNYRMQSWQTILG